MKKGGSNSPAKIAEKITAGYFDGNETKSVLDLKNAIVEAIQKERISKLRSMRRLRAHYVKLLVEARDP